jgi:hypothetical protein
MTASTRRAAHWQLKAVMVSCKATSEPDRQHCSCTRESESEQRTMAARRDQLRELETVMLQSCKATSEPDRQAVLLDARRSREAQEQRGAGAERDKGERE